MDWRKVEGTVQNECENMVAVGLAASLRSRDW